MYRYIKKTNRYSQARYIIIIYMNIKNQEKLLEHNLILLEKISNFKQDWNGNNAPPFSAETIGYYSEVIKRLKKQPNYLLPTGRESILLRYEKGNYNTLHIELAFNKIVSAVSYINNEYDNIISKCIIKDMNNIIGNINIIVGDFYSQKKEL